MTYIKLFVDEHWMKAKKKKLVLKDCTLKNFLEVIQLFWKILVYNIYAYCHLMSFFFFFVEEIFFSPKNL